MDVNRRFFEGLMADRQLSLRQLAAKMGMSHSQLSLTFSGSRRMQLGEACKLAEIFGVTLQQVAFNAGISGAASAGRRVSVIGALRGTGEVEPAEGHAIQRTLSPDGLPPKAEAIQARTADSPLAWMDGFVMFFDPETKSDGGSLGRFCYIELGDGRHVVATLRRGYQEGAYGLSGPFNSEGERIAWAAPILLTRHQ